jgi:hypothetical protein
MPDTHASARFPNFIIQHKANKLQPPRDKWRSALNISLALLAPSFSLCIKRSVRKYPTSPIVSRLYLQRSTHQSHPGRPQSSVIAQVRGCSTSRVSFLILSGLFFPAWRMVLCFQFNLFGGVSLIVVFLTLHATVQFIVR